MQQIGLKANTFRTRDLDLITIKLKFTNGGIHTKIKGAINFIFVKSMVVMQNQNVLGDVNLFEDFDKNHIQLYEADPFWFRRKPDEYVVKSSTIK